MEDKLHNLKAHAEGVALTEDEKSAGRSMLTEFMALTPWRSAQEEAPAPRRGLFRLPSFAGLHVGRTASVFAASFALLLSVGGVSYAAESAVPGDTLYQVKVAFNEPVRSALTVSAASRAEWEAERASRRLVEAEELAHRGELKPEMQVALDAKFQAHAAAAEVKLAKVRETKGEAAAANVSARMEGTLNAHQRIIGAIADKDKNNDGEKRKGGSQMNALAVSVNQAVAQREQRRGEDERRVTPPPARANAVNAKNGADVRAVASIEAARKVAVKRVTDVRAKLSGRGARYTDESRASAEARLKDADAAIAQGDAHAADKEHREALAAYAKAQRLAQEVNLVVRASNQLKVRVPFPSRQR